MSPSTVIAHLLGNDSPGGTQSTTLEHVRLLSKQGVQQFVLFNSPPTGDRTLVDRLCDAGAGVLYVAYTGRPLSYVIRLAAVLASRRVSAVFSHGIGMHLLVAVAARAVLVRRVFAIAGNPIPQDDVARRVSRRRTRLAGPFTTKILAYSHHVRSSLVGELRLDGGQVEVLYHPMDVSGLADAAERARSSRAPGSSARIIMVARLDPIKDQRTVISALHVLRDSGRDVELRLVGSGEIEAELRALTDDLGVKDAVHFLGSRSDIPQQLGDCDVFVYGMTRDEGFGVALVEAMAAGIPVICTDAGPAREVLRDGLAGVLVPEQDAQALADSIARLLDDEARRTQLVTTASQVCRERHGYAVIGEQLFRLLGLEERSGRSA